MGGRQSDFHLVASRHTWVAVGALMPWAPKVACHCGRLNCREHRLQARQERNKLYDERRAHSYNRSIYKSEAWQRCRAFVLSEEPWCMIADLCVARTGHRAPSTDIDHKVAILDGGDPFQRSNLQGACHECHAAKTAAEIQARKARRINYGTPD